MSRTLNYQQIPEKGETNIIEVQFSSIDPVHFKLISKICWG